MNLEEKIYTDLVLDQKKEVYDSKTFYQNGLKIVECRDRDSSYSTIYFHDISDKNEYLSLQKVLLKELEKFIKVKKDDVFLVIGLGNKNSTPDSLGPQSIQKVLVTRHFFLLGSEKEDYANVSVYEPNVIGNTGVDSLTLIKSLIQEIKPTKVIAIDALKANHLERLIKTIQITNSGIHPGSGISNDRGEISKKTMGCDVIAIGIPTVVDIRSIIEKNIGEPFIVTPTNIDYVIEQLSYLLGDSLNILFHKDYLRQIKSL